MSDTFHRHLFVLTSPALHLTLDVAVVTRECSQSGRVDIYVVEAGQGARERGPDKRSLRLSESSGRLGGVTQNVAFHKLHDVEGAFIDALVDTEAERSRDRNALRCEGRDDGVFAHHVVSRREDVARRRTTQREMTTGGVGDAVGEIGATTGNEIKGQRRDRTHVLDHPGRDRLVINAENAHDESRLALWQTPLISSHRDGSLRAMADVTDLTFGTEVLERSRSVPVIVDLWAEWCTPCKALGPILEKVIGETNGAVELAKVDVDANPAVARMFQVQSIPAVFAIVDEQIVDGFTGAQPEAAIREFVNKLAPMGESVDQLLELGDETSLRRAYELDAADLRTLGSLGDFLMKSGRIDELTAILESASPSVVVNALRAQIDLARRGISLDDSLDSKLDHLLAKVRDDAMAREELISILDALGPEDPRYVSYRRQMANRLY